MTESVNPYKLPSEWTKDDLSALDISIISKNEIEFFGQIDDVNIEQVPYEVLNCTSLEDAKSIASYRFLWFLEQAIENQHFDICNLASDMFKLLNYDSFGKVFISNYPLNFYQFFENIKIEVDLCLFGKEREELVILLVLQDRFNKDLSQLEPMLIVNALAVFQFNSRALKSRTNQYVDNIILPAIILKDSKPIFYIINLTEDLNKSLSFNYPIKAPTIVERCNPFEHENFDIFNIEVRKKIFMYLKLFKAYIKDL